MTEMDLNHHEGLRDLLDQINTMEESIEVKLHAKLEEIEQLVDSQNNLIEETWNDWQPSEKLIPKGESLTIVRSEVNEKQQILLIVHHAQLGALGVWLPEGNVHISPGCHLTLGNTRVKVAVPTKSLQKLHNLRGIVAVENPKQLNFTVPNELKISESKNE